MGTPKAFFHKLNENWSKKSPKQKWQMVYDVANKCSEIVGIRFLSDNQRNWRGICCAVLLVYFYSTLIYTLVYYGVNGRFLSGFRCLCLFGIMVAVGVTFNIVKFTIINICNNNNNSSYFAFCCCNFQTGHHNVREGNDIGTI